MKQFVNFFKDSGDLSMMRLLSFILVCVGSTILIAGIPLDIILDKNLITGITGQNLTPIITAGISVITLGLGAKAIQKTQENATDLAEINKP
jgi:hypothetical protein